jgi:3-phosphoshikimate 1-carboxyvinyltransferase
MTDFPEKYRLSPGEAPTQAEIQLPGSKSYTNRALLLAALTQGTSTLSNALYSDDTEHMVKALTDLGVSVRVDWEKSTIEVEGSGGPLKTPEGPIYCGNSGTTIRFLTPFCTFGSHPVVLTGNERMQQRPIGYLLEAIRQLGGKAFDLNGSGCPPIRVEGGGLEGGVCRMNGDVSSQYVSSLLLSGVRMKQGVTIEIEGDLISKPYIDMTLDIIEKFGVETHNEGYQRVGVFSGQEPQPLDYVVEGDASGASYFLAAAAITGKTVRVGPIPSTSRQGDINFVKVLQQMGCTWSQKGSQVELTGAPVLNGIDVDLGDMSDMAQTLAVVALFAEGPTTIRNIANIRLKETDRIRALNIELTRLGARVDEFVDGLTITPARRYSAVEIETYDDHRMAMSFAVAGIRVPGLIIRNPACVSKTFPYFFDLFHPWVEVRDPEIHG